MLRFGFLPSDFHPVVLFLGEAEAMRELARLLRRFAEQRTEVLLETCEFCAPADEISIALAASGSLPGMRPVPHKTRSFTWTVEPWQAEMFAELVERLAEPERKSGSASLECESIGELPVKVSLGEYTDDFLRRAAD